MFKKEAKEAGCKHRDAGEYHFGGYVEDKGKEYPFYQRKCLNCGKVVWLERKVHCGTIVTSIIGGELKLEFI